MLYEHMAAPMPDGEADSNEWSDWLKSLRMASGLSQRELGIRVGVDRRKIISWEKGEHVPSGRHLVELIRACGYAVTPTATAGVTAMPTARDPLVERLQTLTEMMLALRDEVQAIVEVLTDRPPAGGPGK